MKRHAVVQSALHLILQHERSMEYKPIINSPTQPWSPLSPEGAGECYFSLCGIELELERDAKNVAPFQTRLGHRDPAARRLAGRFRFIYRAVRIWRSAQSPRCFRSQPKTHDIALQMGKVPKSVRSEYLTLTPPIRVLLRPTPLMIVGRPDLALGQASYAIGHCSLSFLDKGMLGGDEGRASEAAGAVASGKPSLLLAVQKESQMEGPSMVHDSSL